MKRLLILLFLGVALTFTGMQNVWAHSLWIERNPDNSFGVFFGEFAEGLKEKSGGKLDKIASLTAWTITSDGQKEVLSVNKLEVNFNLESKTGNVIVQELNMPVRQAESKEMGKPPAAKSKSYLYARFSDGTSVNLKPELKLDVLFVETGKVQIFFDGQPLAEKKVVLTASNGWSKELTSDAQGMVLLDQPWPGLYVIDVNHIVEQAGNFNGQDYENERHHAAFSLEKI